MYEVGPPQRQPQKLTHAEVEAEIKAKKEFWENLQRKEYPGESVTYEVVTDYHHPTPPEHTGLKIPEPGPGRWVSDSSSEGAILKSALVILKTGGAVEIAGLRIERLTEDTTGGMG